MNTETQEQPIEEIDYSDLIATSLEQSDSVALNALLGSITISEALRELLLFSMERLTVRLKAINIVIRNANPEL